MDEAVQGALLRIYVGDSDRWEGEPLYHALMMRARQMGLAGATVIRGVAGFGAHSRIHSARLLRLSEDLPVIVEVADTEERIGAFLPHVRQMVREGLVTLERVQVLLYRPSSGRASSEQAAEHDAQGHAGKP
ncbi:DUF190 domain-containing protein [Carboxydochorda subterranea]|uniref:DUF190 domain-containing protein n=1 Tax=Carboxydichorda subterranea TaxID=3109565 RepID=A0ABZ1BU01_9FIRM|nr:DUF190 domain-containing protein [Limnochorda sp. L945t]WRP16118.1 DUF190 domain-containing protein [Limnochorda sp. L945t]